MPSPANTIGLIKRWLNGTETGLGSDDITLAGDNTHSGANTFSGGVRHTGYVRDRLVKITTTSVLTTTTLTRAAHGGARVVISTGTSLSVARHRIKLPSAATGTSGDTYIIVSGITGTPTSNGVFIKPTTGQRIRGTTAVSHGLKGSTRGKAGSVLALQSDGDSNYWIVGRGVAIEQPSTSLIWATTA